MGVDRVTSHEETSDATVRKMTPKSKSGAKSRKPSSKMKTKSKKKAGTKKKTSSRKKSAKKTTKKKKAAAKKSAKKKTAKKSSRKKAATKKKAAKKSTRKKTAKKSTKKRKTKKKSAKKKTPKKKSAKKKSSRKKSSKKKTPTKRSKSRPTSSSSGTRSRRKKKRPTRSRKKKKVIVSMFEAKPADSGPPQASAVAAKALKVFDKGMKAFHKKQYEKAETYFQEVTEGYPSERELAARVRMYLRVCDQHLGDRERKYETPHDHYYRAVILSNRGKYDQALKHLDSAKKMVRRRKKSRIQEDQILFVTATTFAQQGETKSALKNLEEAIQANPRNRVLAFNNPDFDSLRENPDFQGLLDRYNEEE